MANSLALYVTSKSKRATEGVIQNVRAAVPPSPPSAARVTCVRGSACAPLCAPLLSALLADAR